MLKTLQRKYRCLGVSLLLGGFVALGTAQQPDTPALTGRVSGTVLDPSGAVVLTARISLIRKDLPTQTAVPDNTGHFQFDNVPAGPLHLSVSASGFAREERDLTLLSGEHDEVPPIRLRIVGLANITVTQTSEEIATAQVTEEEHQRTLLIFPNFYTSYEPHPAPMTTKLKYHMAWRASFDPVNLVLLGAAAGIQQANNSFSGYGQGAAGYGRRYGANTANFVSATFLGGAIFPQIFKQDPRYIYKGTGSVKSRTWYAITRVLICPGDNGKSEFNYSNVLGTFASGGLSNLYYPDANRGVALTFENGGLNLAGGAVSALIQEFGLPHLIVGHKAKKP